MPPDRYVAVETDRPVRLAEGLVFDPVTGGLLVTTRDPTDLLHVDLHAEQVMKPVRKIARGCTQFRNDGIDITPDGRSVLLSDFAAGTICIVERLRGKD